MAQVTLTREQKDEVRHAIQGRIILDYGTFDEMEPERADMFYTFLGIVNVALMGIEEEKPKQTNKP
jgi:hypothetical protein